MDISLRKANVVKVVASEDEATKLEKLGFKRLASKSSKVKADNQEVVEAKEVAEVKEEVVEGKEVAEVKEEVVEGKEDGKAKKGGTRGKAKKEV